MGADIAANPHYPVLPCRLRFASSRSASLAISGPQNDALRRPPEQSGDGLVGPLSGAGRTWKALHHLFLRPPSDRCPSDGLHFLYPIGSVSTRGNRYVP